MQQVVLLLLFAGVSLHQCCQRTCRSRSTIRRWRDWLATRSERFTFFLQGRLPELGRHAGHDAFWRHVLQCMSLALAMVWLDKDLSVP